MQTNNKNKSKMKNIISLTNNFNITKRNKAESFRDLLRIKK